MDKLELLIGEKILGKFSMGGGCIADSKIIQTENGNHYFVKSYLQNRAILQCETNGLKEIKKCNEIRVPEIIAVDDEFLVLEYIDKQRPSKGFYEMFGRQFANLHKITALKHGFTENNFIGTSTQRNLPQSDSWKEFYYKNRLEYQFYLCEVNGFLGNELKQLALKMESKIDDIFDGLENVPASLLHGDLWSGNYLVSPENTPVLIDPAVYYGHREADLAMTKLFGAFNPEFYLAYNEVYPLDDGYQYRENIYKLYHILNHLNLFGYSYYSQAVSLIKYYFN